MIVGSLGTVESFPVLFSVKMLSRDGWDGHGTLLSPVTAIWVIFLCPLA